jgi:hypothetical protein
VKAVLFRRDEIPIRILSALIVFCLMPGTFLTSPVLAEQSGCRPEPQKLEYYEAKKGNICPDPKQQDVYFLDGVQGANIILQMEKGWPSALVPSIELWDCCVGDGTALAKTHAGSGDMAVWLMHTLPYTGTYAVRVGSAGFQTTGTYSIRVVPVG